MSGICRFLHRALHIFDRAQRLHFLLESSPVAACRPFAFLHEFFTATPVAAKITKQLPLLRFQFADAAFERNNARG